MAPEGLSPAVRAFIREHIQSVEQMEILALICSAPEREWTSQGIDAVILTNENSIARRLVRFAQAGLLAKAPLKERAYRYEPHPAELATVAMETVRAYQQRPVLVIETIFKPDADSAQSFADAFRLRPK